MRVLVARIGLLCAVAALSVAGCSSSSDPAGPVIDGMTVPISAEINETVDLSVVATDQQGLVLAYEWSCPVGAFSDPNSRSCRWTAPPTATTGARITVRVTNSNSQSTTDSRMIEVIGPTGSVTAQVRSIVAAKCLPCHVEPPSNHGGNRDIDQCGACHVPYGNAATPAHTGSTTGCVVCHSSPEATHFYLRDDTDQTILNADAESECIACHRDGGQEPFGHGRPALDTDDGILASARQGTLRSWIQPGGFMAKYVTASERTTLTSWVDAISQGRVLGYDPYLDAVNTVDFKINGLGDNVAWNSAPEHLVTVEPTIFTATNQVRLKALYSNDYLYIRVQHTDSTASMTRSGSWILDQTTWRHPTALTENDKQSEDRVSIIWNMTIPGFRDRYGCAVKCHGNVPGSSEFTDLTDSIADIWHTKAARALGAFTQSDSGNLGVDAASEAFEVKAGRVTLSGVCDDKWLIWYMNLDDGYDTEDSGRRGDSGSSAYSHNRNSAKTAPKYMETNPDSWSDAMVLMETEVNLGLISGTVIVADPDDAAYDGLAVADAWAKYSALKAIVPERIVRQPAGSRGDVEHAATWIDGVWVHELKRDLLTGNSDDVQFNPGTSTEYPFSIAIFDNCGRGEIPPGHNTYGNGQYQILRFR